MEAYLMDLHFVSFIFIFTIEKQWVETVIEIVFFTMFNTVNIGFNSIFLYSKNSECDTVDIKAQLIFTVMIYDRKSSLLFDRFC